MPQRARDELLHPSDASDPAPTEPMRIFEIQRGAIVGSDDLIWRDRSLGRRLERAMNFVRWVNVARMRQGPTPGGVAMPRREDYVTHAYIDARVPWRTVIWTLHALGDAGFTADGFGARSHGVAGILPIDPGVFCGSNTDNAVDHYAYGCTAADEEDGSGPRQLSIRVYDDGAIAWTARGFLQPNCTLSPGEPSTHWSDLASLLACTATAFGGGATSHWFFEYATVTISASPDADFGSVAHLLTMLRGFYVAQNVPGPRVAFAELR